MGSYDGKLYGLDAATGKQLWAYTTENYVHGTPCVVNGVAHFAGCDEVFHAVDVKTGKERFATSATAYTGASVALVNNVAYFGTFDNQVLALDLQSRKVLWRYEHPDRKFPFYSSAAVIDGTRGARRPRSHGARARCEDRQGALDLHDARAHRFVAGDCRRTRLRRIERRPVLCAGSREREGGVAARRGRGAQRVARPRLWTNRDRLDRRPIALLCVRPASRPSPQALLELHA